MILLVDLDDIVYRASLPVPGVAAVLVDRAARGDRAGESPNLRAPRPVASP